jgi:hypothetical protein
MTNIFYGDHTRWFTGNVVRGVDARGRVQVFIHGIHSNEIDMDDLPWAPTVIPTTEGGISGFGRNATLQPGAFVFGIFLDGAQSQAPMIIGSLTQTEKVSSIQKQIAAENNTANYSDPDLLGDDGAVLPKYSKDLGKDDAPRDDKVFVAMDFLISRGLPPRSAAGVVGNLLSENSNMDPSLQSSVRDYNDPKTGRLIKAGTYRSNLYYSDKPSSVKVDPNKEPSFGIAQWNANVGRWQKLEKWAAKQNPPKDPLSFLTQLLYLEYDMKNGGQHAVWDHLQNANNFDYDVAPLYNSKKSIETNPTFYFLYHFEKAKANQVELDRRVDNAEAALKIYNDSRDKSARAGVVT